MRSVAARAILAGAILFAHPAWGQITVSANGAEARRGSTLLRVDALDPAIVRVRIAPGGRLPEDASWAVPAPTRAARVPVRARADGFATDALVVRIDADTLRLTITDRDGRTLLDDIGGAMRAEGSGFTLRKRMPVGTRYFGLGDKTGPLERGGGSFVNWNTDTYDYGPGQDPTYKSIPFLIGTAGSSAAFGLFLDNSWRSWFDLGHREDGVLTVAAPDGPIDYYVISGRDVAQVVRGYARLTGTAPLIPRWGLGFQQSRYSYATDAEVRAIAARMRAERIPLDVLWLDIDFQDRNRPFTVDRTAFPALRTLANDLGEQGIRLVAITDLHIAHAPGEGHAPYDTGVAGDHFVRRADGSLYVAPVWPGPAVFPDFTRAATRSWWGGLYRGLVNDGIAGFWNDMNEPAVFETPSKTMPLDNRHRIEGDGFAPRDASHAEAHNLVGMQNARATFEGLQRLRPGVRPFVMTRATFAGGQRHAVTWTGDNRSTWEHLRLSVTQLLSLGLSGIPYAGADVGGFTGGASAELLTRWIQIGAFTPIFRIHATKPAPRSEPWVDGPEHLALRRRAIEERYRLMPYLYSVAEAHARTGDPIMRPVFYDYPAALGFGCDQSLTFTLGRDLLVAPSPKPESPLPYDICLPAGGWFDYWSGLPAAANAPAARAPWDVVRETPTLSRLPVFVRAGTILPRQPLVRSTADRPDGPLDLHVYPGADCRGALYDDDGIRTDGATLRQQLRCTVTAKGVTLRFSEREGRYRPWWRAIRVTIHGWHGAAAVGERHADLAIDPGAQTLAFTISDQPRAATIEVRRPQ